MKLFASRVRQDHAWPIMKFGFFSNLPTDTEASNETSSASQPPSSIDITSFSFSYYFAATIFCFFDKLKLKSSKVCFILSALGTFKLTMKYGSFSCLSYEQLTNHKKSYRSRLVLDILVLTKKIKKKGAPVVEKCSLF